MKKVEEISLDKSIDIIHDKVKSDYKKAYHILMEHFDSLPDDVKEDVHEKLNELCL